MPAAHFVCGGYIKLAAVALNAKGFAFIRILCRKPSKSLSAAAYSGTLHGKKYISAIRADIKFKLLNITAAGVVFAEVAAQKRLCVEVKRLGKSGNKREIRRTAAAFLFAYGFVAYPDFFRKLTLGHIFPQAHGADYASGFYLV